MGIALTLLLAVLVHTQGPIRPSPQAKTPRVKSENVLVDIVVRDKNGHQVSRLGPEDFEVYDNGKRRRIESLRLIQGGKVLTASGGNKTELDPLGRIRLIAMMFQSTILDAQEPSRKTALDLLENGPPQNINLSVMAIDHRLEALQAFSNDT